MFDMKYLRLRASCTLLALTLACGSTESSKQNGNTGNGASGGKAGTADIPRIDVNAQGGQSPSGCASTGSSQDTDKDGFIGANDCNDCDPNVNAGAYDLPNNSIDEDCSGKADDEAVACDAELKVEADDAFDAAKAIGLCRRQQAQSWGVIAARWVYPDGSTEASGSYRNPKCVPSGPPHPQSRGILPNFGPKISPRSGKSLLALSTGVARAGEIAVQTPGFGTSPKAGEMCRAGVTPPGFPKESPSCTTTPASPDTAALDPIALELEIKAPSNAQALSFDFDFYTREWPMWVCQRYNDFFVALLKSAHPSTPKDENISFDSQGNPVSVNNGFLEICEPTIGAAKPGGKLFACASGIAELEGTGFDPLIDVGASFPKSGGAATGWLTTSAAIVPGETIRLRFAIWDSGASDWDSTVLVDKFEWTVKPPKAPITQRDPVR
jgi:hypothetical protein